MAAGRLRFGIAGAGRGMSLQRALAALGDVANVTALCDLDPAALGEAHRRLPDAEAFTDFGRMLEEDACDAVVVATPMGAHAEQSVAALRAGKHVLCEVPACISEAEGRAVLAAARDSDAVYMMSENYCFMRPHLIVERMVQQGVFGELTYAEGMYLHDVRSLYFKPDGSLTWRGRVHGTDHEGNTYPTHSLGPAARWMGINRDDALDTVYCVTTPPHAMVDFVNRQYGSDHPGAQAGFWRNGDSSQCLLKTKKGRTIYLRRDAWSSRPFQEHAHELQGTSAAYRTTEDAGELGLVWIDGRSPGRVVPPRERMATYYASGARWEKLEAYADEFEHPLWKEHREAAASAGAGHGGGDLIAVAEFIRAIREGSKPAVDAVDAITWSSVFWWSGESERTNAAVKVPDYSIEATA